MKLSWDFDQISKLCLESLVKLNLAPYGSQDNVLLLVGNLAHYGSRDRAPGFEAGEVAR
ncbi:hypothetical protein LEP1GSC168_4070 [Leptospira santarosai str. HAI134]|nr:hypothetical protein LEP1GSC169_0848 [Leptospira santarosai str. HAI1349]EMO21299.1 hypothetical protein LEP1GSC168_4070 [Leptospira santarosai str. HAI134]